MPDTEATRTRSAIVQHVRAASRAELERHVLALQPAHDALVAAAQSLESLFPGHGYWYEADYSIPVEFAIADLRAAIAAASEAGS